MMLRSASFFRQRQDILRIVMAMSVRLFACFICAAAAAADLHPIVEARSGYLFGAVADGKWIKADEAAKSMSDEATYRVYGLNPVVRRSEGRQTEKRRRAM
jgi:hypothetical protein